MELKEKNKKNFQGEVKSGFIIKLEKLTQENIELGRQPINSFNQQQKERGKNVYKQIPNKFLWHKV